MFASSQKIAKKLYENAAKAGAPARGGEAGGVEAGPGDAPKGDDAEDVIEGGFEKK